MDGVAHLGADQGRVAEIVMAGDELVPQFARAGAAHDGAQVERANLVKGCRRRERRRFGVRPEDDGPGAASPNSLAAAAALREGSTWKWTASPQTPIHSQARLDPPASPSAWMRQAVSSPWRNRASRWCAGMAPESGSNSGARRRAPSASVPAEIASPWPVSQSATRLRGRRHA